MKHCILGILFLLLAHCVLPAQQTHLIQQRGAPLGRYLNRNGTLNTPPGFTGSLDPRGWKMQTDPDGTPRFVRESNVAVNTSAPEVPLQSGTGNEFWDDRFAFPQVNNYVSAIAVSGSNIYIGGWFTKVGDVSANYVAKWDGSTWSPLGSGMNNYVYALAVIDSNLYAGGLFSTAGGVSASNIARWNGSGWSPLGSGTSGAVQALAAIGSDLYAGGYFTLAGGVTVNYVARWNGSNWSALGSGMNSTVYALAASGTKLYVGGSFTAADTIIAHYVAVYDGSGWASLGSGTNYTVTALAANADTVYAGGGFTTAGSVAAIRIAKWNGSSWSALGSGLNNTPESILLNGTDVFVGGLFFTAGGTSASRIARWDGSSWHSLGTGMSGGLNPTVFALAFAGGYLYAGGDFTSAGNAAAGRLARWDGSSWSSLLTGLGMDQPVRAFVVMGGNLYIGGDFVAAAGLGSVNHIIRWDGTSGSTLGSGVAGPVYAMAVSGGDLYVGGAFTTAGGISASYIAHWNGSSWSALGSGMNNTVYALAASGSDVYAGGYFTQAGGVSVNYIAHWNGSSWSAMGAGVNDTVLALLVNGSDVYAGGSFKMADGASANYVARWNGSGWSALGSGASYIVHTLLMNGSNLYASGAGGTDVWNGSAWSSAFPAPPSPANDSDFFVGTYRYNGAGWSYLGSGTNGGVNAIALIPDGTGSNSLYVGGSFTTAGGKPSMNFGRWDGPGFNVAPGRLAFSLVHDGLSAVDSVTVTNFRSTTLQITSAASSSPEFSVTPASATLPYLAHQTFTITFAPLSPGVKNEHILFNDNISPVGEQLPVSGTGGAASFAMVPTGIYYGFTPPNTVRHDSMKVMNTGTETLVISSVTTSAPDLTVSPASATLAPSDSAMFQVTFNPTAEYIERYDTITFVHNAASSPDKFITHAVNVVVYVDTLQDGWNLVSVPVWVESTPESWLFPNAVSKAFAYDGGYQPRDTLNIGPAYWIKYDVGQMEYLGGGYIDRDTIGVKKGWNMVGSIISPVAVTDIGSVPDGIVTSNFFNYNGSYTITDSIRPARGYWVKVDQDGQLILALPPSPAVPPGSGKRTASRIRIIPTAELPPPPPDQELIGQHPMRFPSEYTLGQNYPNPFNPTTMIQYALPSDSYVRLRVFDALGTEVARLVDGVRSAGFRQVEWNASKVASGIYFCRFEATGITQPANTFVSVKKMLLIR